MKCVNINVVEKPVEFEFKDFLPLIAIAGADIQNYLWLILIAAIIIVLILLKR